MAEPAPRFSVQKDLAISAPVLRSPRLRAGQRLDKYKLERRLGTGGFATVYQALDTIEGIRVALKIPHPQLLSKEILAAFRSEARLMARLDHPNILPLRNASFISGHFVIVSVLGEGTLAERLAKRLAQKKALAYAEQALAAVAFAHQRRIIHCDVKPENLILFPGGRLRLTDFGISKVALRTLRASGSGTVGYVAPEQAMGRPSFRSDVFSLGLLLYRMLSGKLPEWPFTWPPPGHERLRRQVHPDLIRLVRRAMEVEPRKRFADAAQMLAAFRRVAPRARRAAESSPARARQRRAVSQPNWQAQRRKEFLRQYGGRLETRQSCASCSGPVSEAMRVCPWCGKGLKFAPQSTRFPAECRRCRRGMKLDWRYCPWCYGPGYEPHGARRYTDRRYAARCSEPRCRKDLMPFMRYCPWCRRKVRRKWKIAGARESCSRCGWGVAGGFWSYCPWCGKSAQRR